VVGLVVVGLVVVGLVVVPAVVVGFVVVPAVVVGFVVAASAATDADDQFIVANGSVTNGSDEDEGSTSSGTLQ